MCGHWFLAWKAEGSGLQANIPTKSIRTGPHRLLFCDRSWFEIHGALPLIPGMGLVTPAKTVRGVLVAGCYLCLWTQGGFHAAYLSGIRAAEEALQGWSVLS